MTGCNTITLNNVEYVRKDSITTPVGPPTAQQIVVIEGRWNIYGTVTENEDGSVTITEAQVIRYWGTTKGLGELAANGPTTKTILDPTGTVRVPAHAVLLRIDCGAW
jgi:hypothetical protein